MQFQIWTRPASIRGPRRSALGLCRVDPFRALFISLTAYGTSISCFCGIGCRVVYSHVVAVFCVLIIVFAIAFYDFCHNASSFNLTGLPPAATDAHPTDVWSPPMPPCGPPTSARNTVAPSTNICAHHALKLTNTILAKISQAKNKKILDSPRGPCDIQSPLHADLLCPAPVGPRHPASLPPYLGRYFFVKIA